MPYKRHDLQAPPGTQFTRGGSLRPPRALGNTIEGILDNNCALAPENPAPNLYRAWLDEGLTDADPIGSSFLITHKRALKALVRMVCSGVAQRLVLRLLRY
ncbi:hypothetical protein SAMN05216593_104394 [Pseudomonas asturiensis]|uniref:Uncharacterized protein n=1 Tax=Pseudomonas asturiensis TaxID=1190415 RepID=A0A1M7MPD7_9PSED|nr:hypothetical protein SAMN05216593_104394 [Pseudomonas asturiensis]